MFILSDKYVHMPMRRNYSHLYLTKFLSQISEDLMPVHLQQAPSSTATAWWQERLVRLTKVLGRELDEDNELLMEELLLEGARGLADNTSVGLETRIAVLSAFVEHVPVSEEDHHTLLALKTSKVLLSAEFPITLRTGELAGTGDQKQGEKVEKEETQQQQHSQDKEALGTPVIVINRTSVGSSEQRSSLFERLVSLAVTPEHTRVLLTVLRLWPAFAATVYESLSSNPWEVLLTRLVGEADAAGGDLPDQLIWETALWANDKKQVMNIVVIT